MEVKNISISMVLNFKFKSKLYIMNFKENQWKFQMKYDNMKYI